LDEVPPHINYAELVRVIEEVLTRFGGCKEERARLEPQTRAGVEPASADSPWREINNIALTRLPEWVPALGLFRCQPTRNGYEAVATWRASSTGRANERRKPNLKIAASGIRDFGDDRGHSAIDLVMVALGLSATDAFAWLDERLQWSSGGPEIRIDPKPEEPAVAAQERGLVGRRSPRPARLGVPSRRRQSRRLRTTISR
jgi:hypothetical protein